MEIYLYRDYIEWEKDEAFEVLEGELHINSRGLITIQTTEDYRVYNQILSFDKLFAIVYKLPYNYATYPREINVFVSEKSWQESNPEVSFKGEIQEEECTDKHIVFNTVDYYKQIISLDKIFAITYER